MKNTNQSGFALIAIVIVIAIIALLSVWFLKPGQERGAITTKQQADKSLEQTNQNLKNYQTEINQQQENIDAQNELNSISF